LPTHAAERTGQTAAAAALHEDDENQKQGNERKNDTKYNVHR
jgi:hypothetical protein